MLQKLEVQNFALIERASISFEKGFHAITGETGSGKSILLGALNLILGERADYSVIRDQTNKTVVEAHFSLDSNFQPWFIENDVDWDEQTVIRREITAQGKSRAFINDTPVQLNQLKELAERLIYIHSQHETLEIRKSAFQFELLDVFSGHLTLATQVKSIVAEIQAATKRKNELEITYQKGVQEKEFSLFQLSELRQLELSTKNYEAMQVDFQNCSQADELKFAFEQIAAMLSSDLGPIDGIRIVKTTTEKLKLSNENLQDLLSRMLATVEELNDIAIEAESLSSRVTSDPETIAQLSASLDEYNKILLKYRVGSQAELLELEQELSTKTSNFSELEAQIDQLKSNIQQLTDGYRSLSTELFQKRKQAIPQLEVKLLNLVSDLKMEHTQIHFELTHTDAIDSNGGMDIQFLFSANKGSAPKPIEKVASGGELSRLMLAIQLIVSENKALPTLILDEIDTGVSGEVALRIGKLLKLMGKNIQLMAITHLPQVAAAAQTHFEVKKTHHASATLTSIEKLSTDDRVHALAKLLSGDQVTSSALSSAAELLNS